MKHQGWGCLAIVIFVVIIFAMDAANTATHKKADEQQELAQETSAAMNSKIDCESLQSAGYPVTHCPEGEAWTTSWGGESYSVDIFNGEPSYFRATNTGDSSIFMKVDGSDADIQIPPGTMIIPGSKLEFVRYESTQKGSGSSCGVIEVPNPHYSALGCSLSFPMSSGEYCEPTIQENTCQ